MTIRRNVTSRPSAAPPLSIPPLSALLVTTLAAMLLTGCAHRTDTDKRNAEPRETSSASITPHGYVEGAQEAAEQQARLLLNDPGGGDTRVLDLVTGEVHETAPVTDAVRIGTDGRFGYLHTARTTHVLDGGAWTVDHGDHVHYYRAPIQDVGELPADHTAQVRGDATVTVVTDAAGRAALYERAALEAAGIGDARALPGTYTGALVPYAEHLVGLAADAGGAARLVVLDREGARVVAPDAECAAPRGDAVTGRGVVLGCADGALLIDERDGVFTVEEIPYGAEVPEGERAGGFRGRPGSDTLTAPAGDDAVWVLDVGERTWTRVETGPVLAANTAGEGSPLLVLESDGTLRGYDIGTGEQIARTEPLLTGEQGAGAAPVIDVDRSRAYVNDPYGKRVFEIDYNDSLRIARSFDLDIEPHLMAETGR
ncbi:hypothetical protein ACFRI7_37180 [Streptomyces sp. NPDC056716]|uniref:hypothetical protein n=1 Tax=unclassified Streptomyces TaxID=2593676 RepID=UPI00368E7A86